MWARGGGEGAGGVRGAHLQRLLELPFRQLHAQRSPLAKITAALPSPTSPQKCELHEGRPLPVLFGAVPQHLEVPDAEQVVTNYLLNE